MIITPVVCVCVTVWSPTIVCNLVCTTRLNTVGRPGNKGVSEGNGGD